MSHADWTHHAHLAVGTWYVYEFGPVRGLAMLRDSIRSLNDRHGTPNSDTRGYHETITRAYICLIADVLAGEPVASAVDAVRVVMSSTIAPKTALLDYDSHDRLMSIEARRAWLFRLERREPGGDGAELGFWFGEAFQGIGYATEAAAAACAAAFRLLEVETIEAGAQPDNAASLRALSKLGMRSIGERVVFAPSRQRYESCLFFEIRRDDGIIASSNWPSGRATT